MKQRLVYLGVTVALGLVIVIFFAFRQGSEVTPSAASAPPSDEGRVVQLVEPNAAFDSSTKGEIDASALQASLDKGMGYLLVDVREPSEFAEGHIKGAMNIPVGEIEARAAEIAKDRDVVLICRSGRRSGIASEKLKGLGYGKLMNFKGGMLTWTGPVEK